MAKNEITELNPHISEIPNRAREKLAAIFQARPEVGMVYLFGSRAVKKAASSSDYDFAVYLDEPDAVKRHETIFSLSGEMAKVLNTDKIDIHSLNDLQAPELKYRIICEGILLFEREPYRVLVEPRILNEYFDFVYLLRKYHLTKT